MIKLNLGSGTSRYEDYLSVDLHTDADLNHDLTTPLPYKDGEVDKIYSSHVIEHFTRDEWEGVRKDWARVIKSGGTIELRCPDMYKVCKRLVSSNSDEEIELAFTRIYGAQAHAGDFHKNGFMWGKLRDSFPDFIMDGLEPSTDYELHVLLTKRT